MHTPFHIHAFAFMDICIPSVARDPSISLVVLTRHTQSVSGDCPGTIFGHFSLV